MALTIKAVVVENLRGYARTYLPLDRHTTLIVGRNNSGKTSVLRLLDWLLNKVDPDDLVGWWEIPHEIAEFLLPARDARRKARRLTIEVRIPDGRSHRRFRCVDGVADLRFNLRLTPRPIVYVTLGEPRRTERSFSTSRALQLLRRLKEDIRLLYIPSFRDAASTRFRETLHRSFASRVKSRALHERQGGAPAEYRKMKKALTSVTRVVEDLAASLWPEMAEHLPPGFAENGAVQVETDVGDLLDWVLQRLQLRVTTGQHDSSMVPITDVGSGLQSLLDLAVQRGDAAIDGNRTILVIEEPESFLHPSAQRVVTRSLLGSDYVRQLVITTHSSVVVDEARYGDVVICRNQRFYYPKSIGATEREEINSALLTGQGAEMLFARSVLLVEGEGDRLFFEKLRRRLAAVDHTGRTDELFVVGVGGNQSYAPWLRLLESYGTSSDRPITWTVVADGDSSGVIRRAFLDAQVPIGQDIVDQMGVVGAQMNESVVEWGTAITELNRLTKKANVGFALLAVDLEHAALKDCSRWALRRVFVKMGLERGTLDDLLRILGSKAVPSAGTPNKAPWIRGFLGANIPWSEISEDVKGVLQRWLEPVMPEADVRGLLTHSDLE